MPPFLTQDLNYESISTAIQVTCCQVTLPQCCQMWSHATWRWLGKVLLPTPSLTPDCSWRDASCFHPSHFVLLYPVTLRGICLSSLRFAGHIWQWLFLNFKVCELFITTASALLTMLPCSLLPQTPLGLWKLYGRLGFKSGLASRRIKEAELGLNLQDRTILCQTNLHLGPVQRMLSMSHQSLPLLSDHLQICFCH